MLFCQRLAYLVLFSVLLINLVGCGSDNPPKNPGYPSSETDAAIDRSDVQLRVLDISERENGNVNAIVILFNVPLDPRQELSSFVSITPKHGLPVLSEDGRSILFNAIEPEKDYVVAVKSGLKAKHGLVSDQATSKTITTRALPPVVSFTRSNGAVLLPGVSEFLEIQFRLNGGVIDWK